MFSRKRDSAHLFLCSMQSLTCPWKEPPCFSSLPFCCEQPPFLTGAHTPSFKFEAIKERLSAKNEVVADSPKHCVAEEEKWEVFHLLTGGKSSSQNKGRERRRKGINGLQ